MVNPDGHLFFWLCHAVYWILVPRPGIQPMPSALGVWNLYWTTREVPDTHLKISHQWSDPCHVDCFKYN